MMALIRKLLEYKVWRLPKGATLLGIWFGLLLGSAMTGTVFYRLYGPRTYGETTRYRLAFADAEVSYTEKTDSDGISKSWFLPNQPGSWYGLHEVWHEGRILSQRVAVCNDALYTQYSSKDLDGDGEWDTRQLILPCRSGKYAAVYRDDDFDGIMDRARGYRRAAFAEASDWLSASEAFSERGLLHLREQLLAEEPG